MADLSNTDIKKLARRLSRHVARRLLVDCASILSAEGDGGEALMAQTLVSSSKGAAQSYGVDIPSLTVPEGADPFTVLIEFDNEEGSVIGNTAYKVVAASPEDAVMVAQRSVYLMLTQTMDVDPSSLTIFAGAVFAGHHEPVWTADMQGEGVAVGAEDPENHHDPAYYDPARDPYFVE